MLQGKKVHFRLVDCCWQAKQSSCSKYPWVSCATPMAAVRGCTLMSLPGPVLRRKHGEKGMVHSRLCPQSMVSIPRQGLFLASSWQIWISGAYCLDWQRLLPRNTLQWTVFSESLPSTQGYSDSKCFLVKGPLYLSTAIGALDQHCDQSLGCSFFGTSSQESQIFDCIKNSRTS